MTNQVVRNRNVMPDLPWSKVGVSVDGLLTAKEAIEKAGLNWKVKKVPLQDIDGNNVPNHFSIRREDNKESLGVVGNHYTPLQNHESFSFADSIIAEKAAVYENAGSFLGGKRTFLLAKINGLMTIRGKDPMEKRFLFSNSHDGSRSVEIALTLVRISCLNSLNFAIKSAAKNELVRVRHTITMGEKVSDIRNALGLVNEQLKELNEKIDLLSTKKVNSEKLDKFLSSLGFKTEAKETETKKKEEYETIINAFETAPGQELDTAKGTMWGMVNAISYYTDHIQSFRKSKHINSEDENKLNSIWFGSGDKLKTEAFETALAMAK